MIRIQDLGEIAYGGVVTLTEWWDNRRIEDGRITKSEVWKKAGFWSYLAIGIFSTLVSAFGWWRRQEKWMEHVSHGFLYDFPRFIANLVGAMRSPGGSTETNEARAVQEAKAVLLKRQRELEARTTKALGQGREDVTPGEVPVTDFDTVLA